MLAYVKYDDGYRAVLPDRLIKGFAPSDVDDFSKHRKVQAHWRSEDGATEGFYPATVHALAGNGLARTNVNLVLLKPNAQIARSEERPGPSGSIAAVAAPHPLTSDAANADNFVEASFVDMVVDTSAENVSEFILESSVDEVLGLPKEMIYAVPQEHAEEAAGAKGLNAGEGALADGSQQATVNALAAPTCPATEGLFAIVDGQASIHFSLTICECSSVHLPRTERYNFIMKNIARMVKERRPEATVHMEKLRVTSGHVRLKPDLVGSEGNQVTAN
ncbi:hypothetical protein MTO96_033066 [Rhipicephalus appendiculatus]